MNTSPYLSNSFPEIGLTIVNAIAYTRKKVPGFTWIDDANNGKRLLFLHMQTIKEYYNRDC